jgi:4-hydroxybenzoate polyprenyltransferase
MGNYVIDARSTAIGVGGNVMRTALLCIEEARISVQVIFFVRFSVMFLLASAKSGIAPAELVTGGIAWTLGTLFAYLINGAMDVVEDRLNGSGRPIGRGALEPATALRAAWLCAAAAVLVSLGSLPIVILILAYLFCGYAYSAAPFHMKRRSHGTIVVVLMLGGLTYAAGWIDSGRHENGLMAAVFATAMTLWMGLVGAVVKDLSDVRGDAAAGRRTSVVAWGERRARMVCVATPLLVGGGFVLAARLLTPQLTLPAVLLLAGAVVVAAFSATTRSDERRGRSRLPYRAFMVTQYAAHLALLAIVLR